MKSQGMRVLLVVLAVAAMAGAGAGCWRNRRAGRGRAVGRGCVGPTRVRRWRPSKSGAPPSRLTWPKVEPAGASITKAAAIGEPIGPRLSALRVAAGTVEAQGVLESAIEAFAALMQSDTKARDYATAGQLLSASDVAIFAESAPALERAVNGVDTARGHERVAHAVALEALRRRDLIALGAGAAVALIVMLLLVPIPRAGEPAAASEAEGGAAEGAAIIPATGGGMPLPHTLGDGVVRRAQPVPDGAPARDPVAAWDPEAGAPPRADASPQDESIGPFNFSLGAVDTAKGPDLDAVADLCSSLARVQDTRELQGLLERAAKALDATGVIVWMPDGPQGSLRPVLAHGYASLASRAWASSTRLPTTPRPLCTAPRARWWCRPRCSRAELSWSRSSVRGRMFGRDGGRAPRRRRGHTPGSRHRHDCRRPARDDVHARGCHDDGRAGDVIADRLS